MPTPRAIAIIPARLGSTRFPGKALASETGKPMVVHVCERAAMADSVSRVVVATDSDEIARAVRAAGFEAVMTSTEHPNGTSRLAEAAKTMKLKGSQAIVNVQGDEPEIEPEIIDAAFVALYAQTVIDTSADRAPGGGERFQLVGTVATTMRPGEDPENPNLVKVATGTLTKGVDVAPALYFSRSPIPFDRDGTGRVALLRHVGIYCYPKAALLHYTSLPPTPLEESEQLEQLRWLEHGLPIAVAIRQCHHQGIDTPDQYAAFVERFRTRSDSR